MIKLVNAYKDYKKGKLVTKTLKDINLEIENDGLISILGPSGCGKTTLLNILGGLDKLTSGKMYLNELDTSTMNEKKWDTYRNSQVGFVFQEFNLIDHMTVYENVSVSLNLCNYKRKNKKEKIEKVLSQVGLLDKKNKKPNQLSGGEKQRVAIARAIVNDPKIILADEPTGALDTENSNEIMKLLKEISKTKIVLVVTHNEELANEYSDRIIKMKDGKIVENTYMISVRSNKDNEQSKGQSSEKSNGKIEKPLSKVHMTLGMSLLMSYKNLLSKFFRTICTIFAGCIGLIAVALIITVSSSVSEYVNRIQVEALKDKPITISSSSIYTTTGNIITNRVEFPTTNEIIVSHTTTNYVQNNTMNEELVNKIESLDKSKYTIIDYDRSINMKLFRKSSLGIGRIYTSYFTEMSANQLMDIEYDVIAGKRPSKYNEVALLVDTYNTIGANVLKSIGLDDTVDKYLFEDIIGQTYKLIDNNDYYKYNKTLDIYETYNKYMTIPELYETGETITITGILRENPNSSYNLYQSGIMYTKDLTDYVNQKAKESDIVKDQMLYGYEKNVLTGNPFEEKVSSSSTQTIKYQYDNQMEELGAVIKVTSVQIYTNNFEDRKYIESSIKDNSVFTSLSNVYYRDYMASMAEEFDTFIKVLTKVLIIFALISLLVSSIMIGIITYISVNEREKEIGILRSVGARRIDILSIFCSETFIIGILAGVLGVILAYVIREPINSFIQNLVKENISNAQSVVKENLVDFKPILFVWLVLGNSVLTIISGLIPSIKASLKNPIDALKSL